MERCKTYMIMLPQSQSALSDTSMQKLQAALMEISEDKFFISIHPTPLNSVAKYTTTITIIAKSLEAAEPIYQEIKKSLDAIGEKYERHIAELWFGNDALRIWVEPPEK